MKDIFILEGKKYISSRRASEISDYATDYIGQLCRAGKLDCRMVGRTWFVTEQSLHLHKAQVAQSELGRNRIDNLRGAVRFTPSALPTNISPVITAETTPDVLVTSAAIAMPVIEALKPETRLSYEADNRPLGPELKKSVTTEVAAKQSVVSPYVLSTIPAPTITPSPSSTQTATSNARVSPKKSYLDLTRSIILRRVLASGAVIAGLLIVSSITIDVMNSSVGTSGSNQASVGGVVSGIFATLGNVYNTLFGRDASGLALNGSDTLNVAPNPAIETTATTSSGIAVVGSSGNVAMDEAAKQKIQDSFSDTVDVHADRSGRAGVITPIFKKGNGPEFMYVMVPVKDKALNSINESESL